MKTIMGMSPNMLQLFTEGTQKEYTISKENIFPSNDPKKACGKGCDNQYKKLRIMHRYLYNMENNIYRVATHNMKNNILTIPTRDEIIPY